MESATLTRPQPGISALARLRSLPWPVVALVALAGVTAVGFFVYPTFPNYDSYYSLLWGREALHGVKPSFDGYRTPTEHPLAIAFGAVLSLVGDDADRIMVATTLASFVLLAAGMYRLAAAAFTPVVGLIAAALFCSRFDFPFLAARGYIDIPFLALVIWAAALEVERPRRGTPVAVLLALASLLRPEAWVLSGLYFLWVAPSRGWRARFGLAALTAVGPVLWCAIDYVVTGDPLFSQHHTSALAEELGRANGLRAVPSASYGFLLGLDKAPVFFAGGLGAALALLIAPRRAVMPLVLLAVGLGTFLLVGIAGLSIIERYLLVPSLMVMVFAAVTLGGWTMLVRGARLRRAWALGAAALVLYGIAFTATRVNFAQFDSELRFRGSAHRSLEAVLSDPAIRQGLRCGPLSVPNHKLLPDARWVLGLGAGDVLARSGVTEKHPDGTPTDRARRTRVVTRRGVALYATDRSSLLRHALVDKSDDPANSLPLPRFERRVTGRYYGAYVNC
jgi:hypothetical protein